MRFFTLSLLAGLAGVLIAIDALYLERGFIFDPNTLQECSRQAIAAHPDNTTLLIEDLVGRLQAIYGTKSVHTINHNEWFLNTAGGATGSLNILHASLTEYLIIFGTALGTEGHTGVHLANDYFTILTGEQTACQPGDLAATHYHPGDQNFHPRLTGGHYAMSNGTWALELAQGWIPSMLMFGLADLFTSTLDSATLFKTLYFTSRHTIRQMLQGKF